jgi:hypothetical protein
MTLTMFLEIKAERQLIAVPTRYLSKLPIIPHRYNRPSSVFASKPSRVSVKDTLC